MKKLSLCLCMFLVACTSKTPTQSSTASTTHFPPATQTPATQTPTPQPIVQADYTETLDTYSAVLEGTKIATKGGFAKVKELMNDDEIFNVKSAVGYTVEDVDHDGTDECIIGEIRKFDDGEVYTNAVYAIYAIDNNEVNLLFDVISPAYAFRFDENAFFYGNTEADGTSYYGIFHLEKGKLKWKEFFFTKDHNTFYKNTNGNLDISNSEKVSITEDDFNHDQMTYALIDYTNDYHSIENYDIGLRADWAKDRDLSKYKAYEEYVVDASAEKILLTPVAPLKNIKLLSVEYTGEEFKTEEIQAIDALDPTHPLCLTTYLESTIPNIAIQFEYKDQVQTYTITLSGFDGSIVLTPLES